MQKKWTRRGRLNGFSPDPVPWIEKYAEQGAIRRFSDGKILDKLDELFGTGSPQLYYDMLKTSCDALQKPDAKSFFETY